MKVTATYYFAAAAEAVFYWRQQIERIFTINCDPCPDFTVYIVSDRLCPKAQTDQHF